MRRKAQAGEMTLVVIFALGVALIAVGIVAGEALFFGSEYDFRQVNSQILAGRLKQCLSKEKIDWTKDLSKQEDLESFEKELFQKCNLNKEVIKENYIISITNADKKYSLGDSVKCDLNTKGQNIPLCLETIAVYEENEQTTVFNIQTGNNLKIKKELT